MGKYENDYYIIGGANVVDMFGNRSVSYHITWLYSGGVACGFDSAEFARKTADRTVENCKKNPNLCAERL